MNIDIVVIISLTNALKISKALFVLSLLSILTISCASLAIIFKRREKKRKRSEIFFTFDVLEIKWSQSVSQLIDVERLYEQLSAYSRLDLIDTDESMLKGNVCWCFNMHIVHELFALIFWFLQVNHHFIDHLPGELMMIDVGQEISSRNVRFFFMRIFFVNLHCLNSRSTWETKRFVKSLRRLLTNEIFRVKFFVLVWSFDIATEKIFLTARVSIHRFPLSLSLFLFLSQITKILTKKKESFFLSSLSRRSVSITSMSDRFSVVFSWELTLRKSNGIITAVAIAFAFAVLVASSVFLATSQWNTYAS